MKTTIENAKIESTYLGIEDHGILTAYLYLQRGSSGYGFGGYALDSYNSDKKERVGVAFGAEFIRRVLETLGAEKWESLPGKYVRVEWSEGWGVGATRIGHIVEDKWFDPAELVEEMRAEKK